jgi:hypothetical protein
MSSAVVEEILEETKALPLSSDERKQLKEALGDDEVGKTVAGLLIIIGLFHVLEKSNVLSPEKIQRLRDLVSREVAGSGLVDRASVVRAIRGKYAHLRISSDEFAAQKMDEIRLEDRR